MRPALLLLCGWCALLGALLTQLGAELVVLAPVAAACLAVACAVPPERWWATLTRGPEEGP
ncbi:MAG TPA: hypothetical protein VEB22_15205 [Phycisphaerales bacterium]|nr:hypothetical protein [Phycisphaerales bacterium]